ncbi:hypothetical protein TD95_000413 [Thielaviopsis punctulata]|uniref:Cyclin N-terminal domain-containing protein n=1 Tax=Thielaviopsis punctulata TaxID=72032 RepID=A0A0F4ZGX6_9PEZI|nr:hypothetical protein TD95_000413 [Thielaviopsis punctulata]
MYTDIPAMSLDELNAGALQQFIYQPVSVEMISFLAKAAQSVIICDASLMPAPVLDNHTTTSTPLPATIEVGPSDGPLPSLETFITKLVVSSNVQVPTLMSSLVYLNRLRSKLQPMARGLRCTGHRIFLAALILAAKYLNDSSPRNKYWATYSNMHSENYDFALSRKEVNLMEKQLLSLLNWNLRITPEDLYAQLDPFLEPIRVQIADRHQRRMRRLQQKMRQESTLVHEPAYKPAYTHVPAVAKVSVIEEDYSTIFDQYPSPPYSRGRSAQVPSPTNDYSSNSSVALDSPPDLYIAGSSSSSSRATTPSEGADEETYVHISHTHQADHSPDVLVMQQTLHKQPMHYSLYENNTFDPLDLPKPKRTRRRGVFGRMFGANTATL